MTDIIDYPQLYSPFFRMVDLNLLAHSLWCQSCNRALSLKNCVQDKFNKFRSDLEIVCLDCMILKAVSLTKLDLDGGFDMYKKMEKSHGKIHSIGFKVCDDVVSQVIKSDTFRLVDMNLLAHILWCQSCNKPLSLRNCIQDKFNKFRSVLEIKCLGCLHMQSVNLTMLSSDGVSNSYTELIEKRQKPWNSNHMELAATCDLTNAEFKKLNLLAIDACNRTENLAKTEASTSLAKPCQLGNLQVLQSSEPPLILKSKASCGAPGSLSQKVPESVVLADIRAGEVYQTSSYLAAKTSQTQQPGKFIGPSAMQIAAVVKRHGVGPYANTELQKMDPVLAILTGKVSVTPVTEPKSLLNVNRGYRTIEVIHKPKVAPVKGKAKVAPFKGKAKVCPLIIKRKVYQVAEYDEESSSSSSSIHDSDVSEYVPPDSDEDSEDGFWEFDSSDDDLDEIVRNIRKSMEENESPEFMEKCLYCPEEFPSYRKTTFHMEKHHPEFLKLKCGVCERQFKAASSFKHHIRDHRSSLHRICPFCGKISKSNGALLKHLEVHEEANVKCPKCPAVLKPYTMKQHILIHNTPLSCDFCGKKFPQRTRLIEHIWLHVNNKTYNCEICGAKFLHKDNRKTHMKNNHNWVCLLCNLKFKKAEDVEKHTNEHSKEELEAWELDNGTKPFEKVTRFQCEHCFRYLASKQSLQFHIARIHTANSTNQSDGQNSLKRKCSADNNKKKHKAKISASEKITRFQCAHCSKYLASKQSLKSHITRLHLRLKK